MKKVKRLYKEFQPEHYDLTLHPDRENKTFVGTVKIKGRKIGRPNQRITLHQKGLKILSAHVIRHDKKTGDIALSVDRINIQKTYDELRLHFNEQIYPGNYTLDIEFAGTISEPMHGIYPCNFEIDGVKKQLIATQFESHHAREAFPCVDEPQAKATFSLTLITPAGETVISNTPIKEQVTVAAESTTIFESTPRMSTYLLAFAYGELRFKEAKTANGIKVRAYATPDKVHMTDFALDTTVRSLEFFEKYYGVPYPLPKMDIIGLPDFSAAAMENWGLMTFRESVLYLDEKSTSIDTKQIIAMVIGHELAHQWFGNLVTMKWWNDLWLNESFAELMGYRAVDELFPEWDFWQVFIQREVSSALSRDSLPNVQSVQIEVNHPDEIGSVFDPSIVYAKGAALINMVRHLIGEEAFCKGLKSYFTEFKYENTEAGDLWRHLEAASQSNIQEIMVNWLHKPGFPVIEIDHEVGKPDFLASQQRLVTGEYKSRHPTIWEVPLAASAMTDKTVLQTRSQSFKITKKTSRPLTLNHNGHSYFVTQYKNPGHLSSILNAVSEGTLNSVDRMLLVQNGLLLERAGRVSTLDNIRMLPSFSDETDETVWGMLAGIIGSARSLIDKNEALEKKFNAFVRPLAAPLVKEVGWNSRPKDTAQAHKLRSLAISLAAAAEDKKVIEQGRRLFDAFKKPSDLHPDVRQAVYYIAVRYGSDDDFERLRKLYNSVDNPDEQEEISAELTSSRNPSQAKKLLAMLKKDVRTQDFTHWFAWLIRNRYSREITWKWLTENWDWIEERFGSDKSYDYIPRYTASAFSTSKELEDFRVFFEPKSNIALERAIRLGIEEIEGRIKWRNDNEASVKEWLRSLK